MKKHIFIALALACPFISKAQTFPQTFGDIVLGPNDATYGYLSTSQSRFLLNKDIYSTTGIFGAYSSTNFLFKTNNTTRMTILGSNGNIGIGTTSPSEKLHVSGNLLVSDKIKLPDLGTLWFGDRYSVTGALSISHNSNGNTYIDIDKGNLYFRRTNTLTNLGGILGIQNNGTITIGVWERYDMTVTNTDGHILMVNGGILCEKVKVIADVPNSDHVFEPTYKLRSLSEVKSFVILNKHLPEIPSAKEFKENGYSIGQMDDLLLRKVEELTLYMIQLEEKNALLEKRIEELEGK